MKEPEAACWQRSWFWTASLALLVYASSPLHLLPGGDSGELLAEACVGGVAHPPGYPLLLLLLRALRWSTGRSNYMALPFATLAAALNALIASAAAALITEAVDIMSRREHPLEAVTSGLVFALAKHPWEYAIGIEV